ncbi:MAG TPA: LysR substrate-binding domain-containing protein [Solirubrobacteraceae bacterium]|nr:LysR substrate-binding domain-containing protein [Solirubrobacteraceae bacterium]
MSDSQPDIDRGVARLCTPFTAHLAVEMRHLRYFLAVAESRNFSRAAERVGIAQPALSQQIRRLEEMLGTILFIRTNRRVSLTPSGEALEREARAVLHAVQRAIDAAQSVERGEVDQLTIGYSSLVGASLLPRLVRRLRARRPGLALRLLEMSAEQQMAGLADRQLDAGLIIGDVSSVPGVSVTPMLNERVVVAVGAAHPLASAGVDDLNTLCEHRFIAVEDPTSPAYLPFLGSIAGERLALRHVDRVSSVQAQLALVAAGLGASLVLSSQDEIYGDDIVTFELSQLPERPIQLAIHESTHRPALEDLIESVTAVGNVLGRLHGTRSDSAIPVAA